MPAELGLEPGPALGGTQEAILRQDAALRGEPPGVPGHRHLPAPAPPLVRRQAEPAEPERGEAQAAEDQRVGREAALAGRRALLGGGARLVTLTGAGGIGKTRLALETGHVLAEGFADGVAFVDLSHVSDPELVPQA